MKTLIKNVQLIYPGHPGHKKSFSILTDGKKVLGLKGDEKDAKKVVDAKGMYLLPGLVDVQCHSGEPGFEDKEDLISLTRAARAGGFTDLFILPSTYPVIDSKSAVSFITKNAGHSGVTMHALGAISKDLKGEELSEMYDMFRSGARGFTDGKYPINDVNMMKRALYYVKNFRGIVFSFPNDERVAPGGMVNESPANTSLGLKSTPVLAEELMLNRDIYLLRYSDSRMHVATISSEGSVKLLAQAKKEKLDITAGVGLANLLFNEDVLNSFDTNYKTNPPLRSEKDRKALIQALKTGTIDMIVTDHTPEVIENKDVEFDQAHNGMTMLETALAAYQTTLSDDLDIDTFVEALSLRPRKRFGLEMPALEEGAAFQFTLFDPKKEWVYEAKGKHSKASNSPYLGKQLRGQVIEIG
ncbi:MAG: dihydroorotase [Flavobacteriales bacterium]|nr:dihydroorotase [Flavobacteriales bacterium]